MQTAGPEPWIVLLEADGGTGASTIEPSSLHRLVAACGTPAPVSLFSPDRYALQMTVSAPNAASALWAAIERWREALRRCAVPEWELVRAEVLTPAELEAELQSAEVELDGLLGRRVPGPEGAEVDPLEDELLRRALFDSVTGLPSRALFVDEVRRVLDQGSVAPSVHAVMVVRVELPSDRGPDRAPPDDVLVAVAQRLAGAVRAGDMLARVGPVDFAVLMDVRSPHDTQPVAGRIADSIGVPHPCGDSSPRPLAGVGVTVSPGDGDGDRLLQTAELVTVATSGKADREGHRRLYEQFPELAAGGHDEHP